MGEETTSSSSLAKRLTKNTIIYPSLFWFAPSILLMGVPYHIVVKIRMFSPPLLLSPLLRRLEGITFFRIEVEAGYAITAKHVLTLVEQCAEQVVISSKQSRSGDSYGKVNIIFPLPKTPVSHALVLTNGEGRLRIT